jgi:hypothetical protein
MAVLRAIICASDIVSRFMQWPRLWSVFNTIKSSLVTGSYGAS